MVIGNQTSKRDSKPRIRPSETGASTFCRVLGLAEAILLSTGQGGGEIMEELGCLSWENLKFYPNL